MDGAGFSGAEKARHFVDIAELFLEGEDVDELRGYIEKHVAATESTVGADLLADWDNSVSKFVRVMPTDYKAVLEKMKAEEALEATAA